MKKSGRNIVYVSLPAISMQTLFYLSKEEREKKITRYKNVLNL
jgi:hypothetical protein